MLDCETSVKLRDKGINFKPQDYCNPGWGNDFAWCVSLALRLGYYYNAITYDEYLEYVKFHYSHYYKKVFNSKIKMCQFFFERYFSEHSKMKFGSLDSLFDSYVAQIMEKGVSISVRRGGDFVGCYEDDWGRRRPITSPVYYESIVPDEEKLWVCFTEELLAA